MILPETTSSWSSTSSTLLSSANSNLSSSSLQESQLSCSSSYQKSNCSDFAKYQVWLNTWFLILRCICLGSFLYCMVLGLLHSLFSKIMIFRIIRYCCCRRLLRLGSVLWELLILGIYSIRLLQLLLRDSILIWRLFWEHITTKQIIPKYSTMEKLVKNQLQAWTHRKNSKQILRKTENKVITQTVTCLTYLDSSKKCVVNNKIQ